VTLNLPNLLTWLRIAAIPLFIAVLYVDDTWLTQHQVNIIATSIFVAAAITDWFDGYLARKLNQTSAFGAFLDPVADKLMVAREWMAQLGQSKNVAVSMLGKIKTVSQLVAIPFLLYDGVLFGVLNCRLTGRILIWVAAVLTIWSMFYYLKAAFSSSKDK
jgi:phosphatidylglycerophosphate synthase